MPVDVKGFNALEHSGWEKVPRSYESYWAGLTSRFVAPLLGAARVGQATRLLDVACGLGPVSAVARALGADPLGLDFSLAMVARARELHPDLKFRQGDAQQLAFADRAFEAVTMNNTTVDNNQYASGAAIGADMNATVTNVNGSVNLNTQVACNTADVSTDPAYTIVAKLERALLERL